MTLRVPELDETLLAGCRILDTLGIFDSSGHLTYRVPGTNSFVISARKAPGLATASSLMVIDENGTVLEGEGTIPLEWAIHGRIYRARADVNSIVHSHSAMSRSFSISTQPLRPVYGIAAPWLHDEVPVLVEHGPVASAEAGDRLVETLNAGPAALLYAHGSVLVGASLEETVVRAATFEQVAESLQRALAMGEVRPISDSELTEWRDNTPSGHGKAWDYLFATVIDRGTHS